MVIFKCYFKKTLKSIRILITYIFSIRRFYVYLKQETGCTICRIGSWCNLCSRGSFSSWSSFSSCRSCPSCQNCPTTATTNDADAAATGEPTADPTSESMLVDSYSAFFFASGSSIKSSRKELSNNNSRYNSSKYNNSSSRFLIFPLQVKILDGLTGDA